MVLPLGALGMVANGPPPDEVKGQKCSWNLLMFLFFATCAARVLGLDIFGALLSGLMGGVVYYMVKDGFENMPRMITMFGILCCFNAFFELLPLFAAFRGRTEQKVDELKTENQGGDPSSVTSKTYSVTLETHPFFDLSMGLSYNAQSVAMIASPICMIFGAFLSYHAYTAFVALQPPTDPEGGSLFGGANAPSGGGGNAYGTQAGGRALGRSSGGVGPEGASNFQMFGGQGRKLGG